MLESKKDYQDCLMRIISPLEKYYTDGCAGVKCGNTGVNYSEGIARMEGFARGLWGLGPFWGGGGEDKTFEEIYLKGICNGTDPNHPEYWGEIPNNDQRHVETAAMGLSLIVAPHKIWEPLNEEQKQNLYNWLIRVNEVTTPDNNWNFFRVLVNIGLKNVGMPYNKDVIESALERIESFYKGNGWYSDGNTDQYDYYIAFALHFYGLIYAKVMEKDDAERSKIFKERAMQFAQDFIYWFAEDGSALAFGRSLTYRFAQCCFWSACIFADIEPFPMGVMKGIIARNLEWWLDKPIFDNGGVLTIGYAYPNINMSEGYNGFGSPYWALKTFLILALDDEHEFFKTECMPLPQLDALHVIPEAKMVMQRMNGDVIAMTAGQWASFLPLHVAEKYAKFVYSSKYAFSVPRSYFMINCAGIDNMLTFVKDNICFVRRICDEVKIEENGTIYSKWSPCQGIEVETTMIPTETGHIRKHTVTCDQDVVAYDCGFSIPQTSVELKGKDMDVLTGNGESSIIVCQPNMNLMYSKTVINGVKYELKKGVNQIETTVVYPNASKIDNESEESYELSLNV